MNVSPHVPLDVPALLTFQATSKLPAICWEIME